LQTPVIADAIRDRHDSRGPRPRWPSDAPVRWVTFLGLDVRVHSPTAEPWDRPGVTATPDGYWSRRLGTTASYHVLRSHFKSARSSSPRRSVPSPVVPNWSWIIDIST